MNKLGLGLSLVAMLALGCGDDDTEGGADAGAADAGATETSFAVILSADDEEPFCTFAGADAAGEGTVTVSADLTEVDRRAVEGAICPATRPPRTSTPAPKAWPAA